MTKREEEGFHFGFWIADPFTSVQDKLWIGKKRIGNLKFKI